MLDPEEQFSTLKLIDERQVQLLEDLDRLNQRIETIIELYSANRPDSASDTRDDDVSRDDQPEVAA